MGDIGTDLEEITPEFIRDYLDTESEELEFPIALEDMPIAMLSKKEWMLSILIFCAEAREDRDYTHLTGLPLELTLDNKLNSLFMAAYNLLCIADMVLEPLSKSATVVPTAAC